jgi:hypothetical protein
MVDPALGDPTHGNRERSDGIGTTIEHNEAKYAYILLHRHILGEGNPLFEFSVTSALNFGTTTSVLSNYGGCPTVRLTQLHFQQLTVRLASCTH